MGAAGVYQGLILQPTYRVRHGRPVVQLYGRLADGPPFLVEDDRFRPYFFVPTAAAERVSGEPDVQLEATSLRNLAGEARLPGWCCRRLRRCRPCATASRGRAPLPARRTSAFPTAT